MSSILEQLNLDHTFFIQFALFAVLFVILSPVYFRPFMKLIAARHRSTVEDREAAEKLMVDAQAKLDEYKRKLAEARADAKKEYETAIDQAKKEETKLLGQAREDAKKITQEAIESIARQKDQLKKQLEVDVESLARTISEKLISSSGSAARKG